MSLSDLSLLLLLIISLSSASSKPIDVRSLSEDANEIDTGVGVNKNKLVPDIEELEVGEIPRPISGRSDERTTLKYDEITNEERSVNPDNATADNTSTRQQGFDWFFTPFIQKLQFRPQAFFHDKIGQLKDTLDHLGSIFPNQQDADGKQFSNGAVQNLVGSNDSGFYTDRLDPAGFFGGNGWFANKGGILGGPGAFISTGSLFTDYPTPYKK